MNGSYLLPLKEKKKCFTNAYHREEMEQRHLLYARRSSHREDTTATENTHGWMERKKCFPLFPPHLFSRCVPDHRARPWLCHNRVTDTKMLKRRI